MQKFKPAVIFHPGEYLLEELQERHLTQTALAQILKKPLKTINEIINGKKSITPEVAFLLEGALNISADTWLSLQKSYDLHNARPKIKAKFKQVQKRAKNYFDHQLIPA